MAVEWSSSSLYPKSTDPLCSVEGPQIELLLLLVLNDGIVTLQIRSAACLETFKSRQKHTLHSLLIWCRAFLV